MTTWKQISQEGFSAAQALLAGGHFRSAISRAYFAMYAAITDALIQNKHFRPEHEFRPNPGHQQMLDLLKHNLFPAARYRTAAYRVNHAARRAHRGRVMADYASGIGCDRGMALQQIRDARFVAISVGGAV